MLYLCGRSGASALAALPRGALAAAASKTSLGRRAMARALLVWRRDADRGKVLRRVLETDRNEAVELDLLTNTLAHAGRVALFVTNTCSDIRRSRHQEWCIRQVDPGLGPQASEVKSHGTGSAYNTRDRQGERDVPIQSQSGLGKSRLPGGVVAWKKTACRERCRLEKSRCRERCCLGETAAGALSPGKKTPLAAGSLSPACVWRSCSCFYPVPRGFR